MAHGVVCHFDLPHMAQKVADWTRREGRPRADEMAHGAVCRFELPHVAENNRRVTRVDSSLWPQRTVPKLPSGTNGCQTLKTATLNTSYFCQKRPLCQPPPSPTPPPNSHFVRKVKLRLTYRLAFVIQYNLTDIVILFVKPVLPSLPMLPAQPVLSARQASTKLMGPIISPEMSDKMPLTLKTKAPSHLSTVQLRDKGERHCFSLFPCLKRRRNPACPLKASNLV